MVTTDLHAPDIPIVVVAYNRPHSLKRLLVALTRSIYPPSVDMVISIDGGSGDANDRVVELARAFEWPFGHKEVRLHRHNLGLVAHLLECGDLAQRHDGIIVLEDEIFVSRHFYAYAMHAYAYYKDEEALGGISLYSHGTNQTAKLPFHAIEDGSDVFFMQVVSSWGQLWTRSQWKSFREWLTSDRVTQIEHLATLPQNVASWQTTSWKKLYFPYLLDTGKFFVYPRCSLSTNFGKAGVHMKTTSRYQVPLQHGERTYKFMRLSESTAKYDAFCELLPECLNRMFPALTPYDYIVDLYAMKPLPDYSQRYALTTKKCESHVMSWGRELRPHETNIVEGIEGDEIFLALVAQCERIGDFRAYRSRAKSRDRKYQY